MRSLAQELAARTNPLSRSMIDKFQATLTSYLYSELVLLEESESEPDFDRWVGCYEYGPNTYLAEVTESLSISQLHFSPRIGFYVYPGRIIDAEGEVRLIQ